MIVGYIKLINYTCKGYFFQCEKFVSNLFSFSPIFQCVRVSSYSSNSFKQAKSKLAEHPLIPPHNFEWVKLTTTYKRLWQNNTFYLITTGISWKSTFIFHSYMYWTNLIYLMPAENQWHYRNIFFLIYPRQTISELLNKWFIICWFTQ